MAYVETNIVITVELAEPTSTAELDLLQTSDTAVAEVGGASPTMTLLNGHLPASVIHTLRVTGHKQQHHRQRETNR